MSFFKENMPGDNAPLVDLSTAIDDRIEIEVAKQANAEAKKKVQKINEHLKDLVKENGFHVRIYVAVGGKPGGGHK